MTEKKDREPKFEEALEKLEKLVADMESGQLPLEKSMEKFAEGMKLAQFCSAKLGEAERKIEMLVRQADGTAEWRQVAESAPVPDDADDGEDADAADDDDDEA
jgi:exodeoxyribonuclease VII small subunit